MKRTGAAERWRELLRRQATSGLSVAEFCRRQDVSEASFYQWRKRLRAESPTEAAPADFLPLAVLGGAGVEIELPCGAVVRVPAGDARTLQQLVTLLLRPEAEST